MAAYGKPKKVQTPWATQQSIDGGMPTDDYRPRPSSAASSAAPWEQELPPRRTQRVQVAPPSPGGYSSYSDDGAPRSPYGTGGNYGNNAYGDVHPSDPALQAAWGASLGGGDSQAPPSPSGIQLRHRTAAPFAEEPALEAAWAASVGAGGRGQAPSRGGSSSGYGPHAVPPWDGAAS
jgi:hypothetical protein